MSTPCTYVLSSDFSPKLLSENNGAVRIAGGCKRTSIQGESVEVSTAGIGKVIRDLGHTIKVVLNTSPNQLRLESSNEFDDLD